MRKIKISLYIIFFPIFSFGQNEIDFHPSMLDREVRSVFSLENCQFLLIHEMNSELTNGNFFSILHSGPDPHGIVYIGRIYSCRADGCDIQSANHDQKASEYFDYFIIFNLEAEVLSVRVYNYQATHGQEVSSKNWLKKFRAYNGEYTLTGKNSVDIISGATVSSNGIINDLQYRTEKLRSYLQK